MLHYFSGISTYQHWCGMQQEHEKEGSMKEGSRKG